MRVKVDVCPTQPIMMIECVQKREIMEEKHPFSCHNPHTLWCVQLLHAFVPVRNYFLSIIRNKTRKGGLLLDWTVLNFYFRIIFLKHVFTFKSYELFL